MNWKGRNKEEIPGSKRTDLLQALKRELLSSVFSLDETLIFASAAPHCGAIVAGSSERANKLDRDQLLTTPQDVFLQQLCLF